MFPTIHKGISKEEQQTSLSYHPSSWKITVDEIINFTSVVSEGDRFDSKNIISSPNSLYKIVKA
jgi:hypothetical protein